MSTKNPLVRRAIAGAALASSGPNPLVIEEIESNWTPAALERAGSTLKALNRMAKRPPVHLAFEDIVYTVKTPKGDKRILNGVSGEFRSGELTAILGPSGAGKSSLLNILVGYVQSGYEGRVTVNGHIRDMRVFKKLSSYIMQDDLLQPRLTVHEAMTVAANLKLGRELGRPEKELIVEEILQTIGLWSHRNTRTEKLSGGQAKRLSIALELVNNPPIIFIDEPTTGLDIVSIRQLVVLLRLLSRQGRTIVCTIHQPSASLFALFDRIYVVARGMCCYQGAAPLLIPFLSEAGHVCPKTHNPADFVLETLSSVNDESVPAKLSNMISNGKLCRKLDRIVARGGKKPVLHSDESIQVLFVAHVAKEAEQNMEFPTSFLTQFYILLSRMVIQKARNAIALWIQFAHHLICGFFLGCIFYNVGNDGNNLAPMVNFKCLLSIVVFFMYTYLMIPILLFPTEVRLIRREYFNRWYSLKAYYTALTFASIPITFMLGMFIVAITYLMSGQPMKWDRFMLFSFAALMVGLCSEGLGFIIGSAFTVTNGSIVGPATISPLLALCVYGLGFGDKIETIMKVLMGGSYLRYGVAAMSLSVYSDRDKMDCGDIYCPFDDPRVLLGAMGMHENTYGGQILALIGINLLHRIVAFLVLRYRLSNNGENSLSSSLISFGKCLRQK